MLVLLVDSEEICIFNKESSLGTQKAVLWIQTKLNLDPDPEF